VVQVDAGVEYVVQEVAPGGGIQVSFTGDCTETAEEGVATVTATSLAGSESETAACTVVNTVPSVMVQVTKECLGTFAQTNYLIRVLDPQPLTVGGALVPCGGTGAAFPVDVGVEYTAVETNAGADVNEVRYRGACDGDGSLTPTVEQVEAGTTLTCVVTNVDLIPLTITKDCEPDDLVGGPFTIEVYRETVDPGNLEASLSLACDGSEVVQVDAGVEYVVQEVAPGGGIQVSFTGDCTETAEEGVATLTASSVVDSEEETAACTVVNTAPSVLLQVTKECLGTFAQESFLIRVREPDGPTIGGYNGDCGGTGTPFPVYAGVLYQVRETNAGADVNEVRYRGACDGDGSLTPTVEQVEAGTTLTCVVTNVDLIPLTITKDCEPDDLAGGPFTIEVYRETVDPGNLEASLSLACDGSEVVQLDAGVEYVVQEAAPGGDIQVSFTGDCTETAEEGVATVTATSVDASEAETAACTVVNTGPTASLVIQKECLGEFPAEVFVIELRQDATPVGEPIFLDCDQSSDPIQILTGVEYTVVETIDLGADDVRYRGVCDGDGTLTVPVEQADQTVTCVVTNVDLIPLTVTKDCDPDDLSGGPFTIEVYRLQPEEELEASLSLDCEASEVVELDAGIPYAVRETTVIGGIVTTFTGDCVEGANGAEVTAQSVADSEEEAVTCTVVNTLATEPFFYEKYTDPEDEVLAPGEQFSWYIDVPAGSPFFLLDILPPGFTLVSINAPAGVSCNPIWVIGAICTGNGVEDVTIELVVRAKDHCGTYTNFAKLFQGSLFPRLAFDSVEVCGEEEPVGDLTTTSTGPTPATSGGSWWSGLWRMVFLR
jgi:hypothetical protein